MLQYHFDHLQLFSPEPDRTAQWYVDVLGARITKEMENPRIRHLYMDLNGTIIEIGGPPRVKSDVAITGRRIGLERFGLKVDNLDNAIEDLKAKGVRFVGELRTGSFGRRNWAIEAPEKETIELSEGDFSYWR